MRWAATTYPSGLHLFQQLGKLLLPFLLVKAQVFLHRLRGIHGAESWRAHGAERRVLVVVVGQRLVVHGARRLGVEGKLELLVPVEEEARIGDGVVTVAGAGPMSCQVCSVGGNLISDDALVNVLAVGQAQVFLGRDVAEHGGAMTAYHG